MKTSLDIVCWAFPSWRGDYTKSTVQLMKELSVRHNVLYVDYGYSIKDVLVGRRTNKYIPVKKILGVERSLETVYLDNGGIIHVLSLPPVIPFNWTNSGWIYNSIQKINAALVTGRVKRAMRFLAMKHPLVVNAFNPFFGNPIKGRLNESATFYYCYDNIAAAHWAKKHGDAQEKQFMHKADALIFSSETLRQDKAIAGKPSFVVNNGVDISIFTAAVKSKQIKKSNNNKLIGYVGSIDDRLNYDLLRKMALQFPDDTFKMIGRTVGPHAQALAGLQNISFTGAINADQLPALIAEFDLGIIPFVKNEFTQNIYPMKINEYFAMGVPVVMSDFAVIPDWQEQVETASDDEAFIAAMKRAMEGDNDDARKIRMQKAAGNSWKQKSVEFENILIAYA